MSRYYIDTDAGAANSDGEEKQDVGSEKFLCDPNYLKNLSPSEIHDIIEFNGDLYYSISFEEIEVKRLIRTDLAWQFWPKLIYKHSFENSPQHKITMINVDFEGEHQDYETIDEDKDIEDVENNISELTLDDHEDSLQSAMNDYYGYQQNNSVNDCNGYAQHYAENFPHETPSLTAANKYNEYSQYDSNNGDQDSAYYNYQQHNSGSVDNDENEYLEFAQNNQMEECNEYMQNNCECSHNDSLRLNDMNINFESSYQTAATHEYNEYLERYPDFTDSNDQSEINDAYSDTSSVHINIYREYQRHNALNIEYGEDYDEEYDSSHHHRLRDYPGYSDHSSECSPRENEANNYDEYLQHTTENENNEALHSNEINEYDNYSQYNLDNAYDLASHYNEENENLEFSSDHILPDYHECQRHHFGYSYHTGNNDSSDLQCRIENVHTSRENVSLDSAHHFNLQAYQEYFLNSIYSDDNVRINGENTYLEPSMNNNYEVSDNNEDNLYHDDHASAQHDAVNANDENSHHRTTDESPLARAAQRYCEYLRQQNDAIEELVRSQVDSCCSYLNNLGNADHESPHRAAVNENPVCSHSCTEHEYHESLNSNVAHDSQECAIHADSIYVQETSQSVRYRNSNQYPINDQPDQHTVINDIVGENNVSEHSESVADEELEGANDLPANMMCKKVTVTEDNTGLLHVFYVAVFPPVCLHSGAICDACREEQEKRIIEAVLLRLVDLNMRNDQETSQTN